MCHCAISLVEVEDKPGDEDRCDAGVCAGEGGAG